MLTRIWYTILLAVGMWYLVGTFYMFLGNEATVISAMIICTSIITYKIDKLRKELKKDKGEEDSEEE